MIDAPGGPEHEVAVEVAPDDRVLSVASAVATRLGVTLGSASTLYLHRIGRTLDLGATVEACGIR